jgi:hypothetical protein
VMAMSGYLSSSEGWERFESAWQQVLNDFGVEMFHMTEFECRLRGFTSWTNETRIEFLGRLIGVIRSDVFVAVGAAIEMKEYEALPPDDQSRLGHPYALCGVKAVADTLRWIDGKIAKGVATGEWAVTERGKNVPVEFVVEAGDEGAGQLAEQLEKEQVSGLFAGRILRCSFENKRGVGALQAADFAAYETTKQLVRTIGAYERAMRRSLEVFVSNIPYVAEYFDRRTMAELLEKVRRDADSGRPG